MKDVVKRRAPGLSLGDVLRCAVLTVLLCVGNAALLRVLFSDGVVVALAYGLTTGLFAGVLHGVVLGSGPRGTTRRLPLYLAATLSWTIVVSIWLCLVAALTNVSDWTALPTLSGLGALAFVPVAVGIEISRAWLSRRWTALRDEADGWAAAADESIP